MKTTIEFGYHRVIVPFQANQTVSQLMTQELALREIPRLLRTVSFKWGHDQSHSKAAERYKKLLSRPCHVQKLETRDGALLCGDDLLKDVIDDKEILGLNIFSSGYKP